MTDHVKEQEEREEGRMMSTAQFAEAAKRPRQTEEAKDQLLQHDRAEDFRSRWAGIQTSFVDEPKKAVEQADALVAEVMQQLAQTFADERDKLESQWGRDGNVSTEDLRIALQRYRAFFGRLLTV